VNQLLRTGVLTSDPLTDHVAAVSAGIYAGQAIVDLDYAEDSEAGTDANFVLTGGGRLVEVQMSAEGATFARDDMLRLLDLAGQAAEQLVAAQRAVVT
jgi:ribonuclease PH